MAFGLLISTNNYWSLSLYGSELSNFAYNISPFHVLISEVGIHSFLTPSFLIGDIMLMNNENLKACPRIKCTDVRSRMPSYRDPLKKM